MEGIKCLTYSKWILCTQPSIPQRLLWYLKKNTKKRKNQAQLKEISRSEAIAKNRLDSVEQYKNI